MKVYKKSAKTKKKSPEKYISRCGRKEMKRWIDAN